MRLKLNVLKCYKVKQHYTYLYCTLGSNHTCDGANMKIKTPYLENYIIKNWLKLSDNNILKLSCGRNVTVCY